MDKKVIQESLKKLREISKKRNFNQSIDLIINLKQLDIKNPEHKVDVFLQLPKPRPKHPKICALIDKELSTKAKIFDKVILKEDFQKYTKDKKLTKKLASSYDYFLAQANLMSDIATAFGKILGPKGKMPNPKAGCIVPPKASLKPLIEKLQKLIRISAKKQLIIHLKIGSEKMDDNQVTENVMSVYNTLLSHLPNERNNVRKLFLKLTMSESFEIGK